jgi:CHAD domain-containing protein
LKTVKEINEEYDKFNKDIEKRNELLKADSKTKAEIEKLQEQIKANKLKEEILSSEKQELENQLKAAKENPSKTKPHAILDTSEPGIILHTNKPVANMKINRPDATK